MLLDLASAGRDLDWHICEILQRIYEKSLLNKVQYLFSIRVKPRRRISVLEVDKGEERAKHTEAIQ
jgi:hypothetical protein